jgi:hypothetical protein
MSEIEMQRTEPLACCSHLRCKSMYYNPDERPGKLHESDVMTYWCMHTQSPVGPDKQDAWPSLCQSHRACYER